VSVGGRRTNDADKLNESDLRSAEGGSRTCALKSVGKGRRV
jgi:hypothetical protein